MLKAVFTNMDEKTISYKHRTSFSGGTALSDLFNFVSTLVNKDFIQQTFFFIITWALI